MRGKELERQFEKQIERQIEGQIERQIEGQLEKQFMQADPVMKNYWRNSRRFADLINGAMFDGMQIIHAEDITAQDTDESGTVENRSEKAVSLIRNRDILKMNTQDAGFVLIALENQQKVHGFMPLRVATYDIMDYNNQEKQWKDSHGKGEALQLIPVYTLVIYYGETEWKKAASLSDLMQIPDFMKPYVNDWHCKVIQVRSYNSDFFSDPEVRSFFTACQKLYSMKNNLKSLEGITLTKETAIAVGVVTGTKELIYAAEKETEGGIDMCRALDNLIKEEREEGRKSGLAEGKFDLCVKLFGQGLISAAVAAEQLELTEEEFLEKMAEREGEAE